MLCERILGTLKDNEFQDKEIDYVGFQWYEAYKKIHKKVTRSGREVGIRLGNDILVRGLRQDDVLFADDQVVIAVEILPCSVLVVNIKPDHSHMLGKVCYEIGNRHGSLFWGDTYQQVVTPYNQPMQNLLSKLHGVSVQVEDRVVDFNKSISSSINQHTH